MGLDGNTVQLVELDVIGEDRHANLLKTPSPIHRYRGDAVLALVIDHAHDAAVANGGDPREFTDLALNIAIRRAQRSMGRTAPSDYVVAKPCRPAWPQPSCAAHRGTQPDLNAASVISSPFIGVELTSSKARTLPQITAVFDPGCVKTRALLRFLC